MLIEDEKYPDNSLVFAFRMCPMISSNTPSTLVENPETGNPEMETKKITNSKPAFFILTP